MSKKQLKTLVLFLLIFTVFSNVSLKADDGEFDINSLIVDVELYIWNRISDALDLFRCGLAGGPGIGAEIAVTEYAQLGAYTNYERGVTFPHFVFPLWLVDYYEKKEPFIESHEGRYSTVAYGPWRKESAEVTSTIKRHFPRNKWDIRAQLDAAFIHAYIAVRPTEIWDFLIGFAGFDPSGDDQRQDYVTTRYPADQFGRSVCNILFGVLEVPLCVIRTTEAEGDFAGLSKGLGVGVWRFICREVIGVVELVTFPFGWQPMIEPDYVFPKNQSGVWRINKPAFQKRY